MICFEETQQTDQIKKQMQFKQEESQIVAKLSCINLVV